MNLKVLTYDSKNGHQELADSIDELVIKVDTERTALASTLSW